MNTKEREKKDKKKDQKKDQQIPQSLQDAPQPKEEEIAPPRPINVQETKGDVPRPTRLPPRFKERFQHTAPDCPSNRHHHPLSAPEGVRLQFRPQNW